MPLTLGLFHTGRTARSNIGGQASGLERRGDERREPTRFDASARRRGQRRRTVLRRITLTALTITAYHMNLGLIALPASVMAPAPIASVTVTVDNYVAVPARRLYDTYIREAARRYGVDAALIRSIVQTESRFNALAVSPRGAKGLMQLTPVSVKQLGVRDPFDPRENIMAGTRYLRQLLRMHGGDVRLALASYNAGPGNVLKYGDVPPFAETQAYVERVIALLEKN